MKLVKEAFLTDRNDMLVANMDEDMFRSLFPIEMEYYNELAFPEPVMGAFIQLEDGCKLWITYKLARKYVAINNQIGQDPIKCLKSLYKEIPLLAKYVFWDITYPQYPSGK